MSPADYQELLNLVTPLMSYQDTRLRKAISADERLAVTMGNVSCRRVDFRQCRTVVPTCVSTATLLLDRSTLLPKLNMFDLFDIVERTQNSFDIVAENGNIVETTYDNVAENGNNVERCFDNVASVDGALNSI